MSRRLTAYVAVAAIGLASCGSHGNVTPVVAPAAAGRVPANRPHRIALPQTPAVSHGRRIMATGTNVVGDPGFESGGFTVWQQCGNGKALIDSSNPHSGSYDALVGNTASNPGEESGYDGVCQTVTVPANGYLSFWVDETTSETSTANADQEADLLDSSGNIITTLYAENGNTNGYVEKTFDLSAYAGQTVTLFFGIYGSGSPSDYNAVYVDDVSLVGGTSGPTPQPTTTPQPTPQPSATPQPTASPAWPCNDQQFLNDQQAFADGTLSGDQEEDVCGTVTQVLPSQYTRSGLHGYFYVQVAPGDAIEVVSNLDQMNAPAWPWVATGDYVYVQGRYYYDNGSSQGIDWTHQGTSSSWPYPGYVVVCNASGGNCVQYQ